MHVDTGDSYYEQAIPPESATSSLTLTFYTYAKSLVYDKALSREAIAHFAERLTRDKCHAASRLYVGLSRVAAGGYVLGYVLDPDKMAFVHHKRIRLNMHYQFKHAKIVTYEMIGTSLSSC